MIVLFAGNEYSWEELGETFGFKPNYLGAVGGMAVSSATDSLLLITHPNGGKSFDYRDEWEGDELIYTGRGMLGDQKMEAQNADVAANRRRLFVFEASRKNHLRFLGQAKCEETRTARAKDDYDQWRDVFRFRLSFQPTEGRQFATPPSPREDAPEVQSSRPFDPDKNPAPQAPAEVSDPIAAQALQEKANQDHHRLLVELNEWLDLSGWSDVEEIPGSIDMWAVHPRIGRTIFEAKTISDSNELKQTRSGFAQLQEYRLLHGEPKDRICLVTTAAISMPRARLLNQLEVPSMHRSKPRFTASNELGSKIVMSSF